MIQQAPQYSYHLTVNYSLSEVKHMTINIRARLSAYSKLDLSDVTLPIPGEGENHAVLTTDSNGNYTLLAVATESDIDKMFDDEVQ